MFVAAIVGAAVAAGSAIYGAVKNSKQKRKMQTALDNAQRDNNSWYNANALTDYTQRADSQNLLGQLRDQLKTRTKADRSTAVVTGATAESQAANKQAANNVVSSVYGNLAAQGQRWKDDITSKYLARKDSLDRSQWRQDESTANSYANMMSNGVQGVGSSLMSLGSYGKGAAALAAK